MDPNADQPIFWVGPHAPSAAIVRAVSEHGSLQANNDEGKLCDRIPAGAVAMIQPNGELDDEWRFRELLAQVARSETIAVMVLPADADRARDILAESAIPAICLSESASPVEFAQAVRSARELMPAMQKLREQARRLAQRQDVRRMQQLDEEMRLAARLQQDFLPKRLPEVGPVRFGVLYRPASFVSGDIYDVRRLDETHVGFYLVDAVGHGMPAALLTMFIKHALQTKRIRGNTYQIVPPDASLAELNADICEQGLSSSQFCTAVYAVLDTEGLTLSYARAGHPEPLLVRSGARVERLKAPGCLLGVFEEAEFECQTVQLDPGDRVLFYSDGLEDVLQAHQDNPMTPLEAILSQWLGLTREELLLETTALVEELYDPQRIDDDVTMLVADVDCPGDRDGGA